VTPPDPFTALRLTPSAALTDDQVRAAWRHIAAATHPDRADGGDPPAYAAAAAAYAQLRTGWGRTEALADMQAAAPWAPPSPQAQARAPLAAARHAAAILPARIRHGRPARITARATAAAAVAALAVTVIPGTAAAPAVTAGCALWFTLTARGDLSPPPGR
jgi:hypothetical protein